MSFHCEPGHLNLHPVALQPGAEWLADVTGWLEKSLVAD